ncbi:MAG: hypothetical protein JO165_10720, partial [Candidatus Eremiobacteraeota bacterium]|nr:hypothetical protein [Candidatus Eremiobacteraeota bacterium]
KRRNELLLRLSLAGVPHAHIDTSNDVLGKVGALTPQSVVEAQTRDGLAGDIELGLRGIAGIDDARVIIAPAKQGYFADEPSHAATASVRLRLHDGTILSHDTVSGVRAFVSASVPGLDLGHVTIVDDRGVALGADSGDEDANALQRSLQSALDAAIGAGNAIVRVRVEYDNRRQTLHDVRRAPLGELAVTNNGERYVGEGKHYERTTQETERGSDTRELTSETADGRIARISAAVFVDAQRAASVPAVRELAAATLGIVSARGDTLSVEAMNLQPATSAKKDAWWPLYGAMVTVLPAIVVMAGILMVARVAGKPLASALSSVAMRVTATALDRKTDRYSPAEVRGALQHEPAHTAAAILSALPASTVAAVLEMYPPHERDAIIRRMQRPTSPLVPDPETFLAKA